jgi:hypothetical protein
MHDLVAILTYFLPENIVWPDALVTTSGCTEVGCMRSCITDQHIGFLSWNDHAAWAMCEIDPKWCVKVANSLESTSPLKKAITFKYDQGDDPSSTRSARWICFMITLANSVPMVLTVLLALWLLPSVLSVCVAAFQFALNMLFTFVLFVHEDEE